MLLLLLALATGGKGVFGRYHDMAIRSQSRAFGQRGPMHRTD
jgi:hypothetical protein